MKTKPAKEEQFRSSYTTEQYKEAVAAVYKLGLQDGLQRRKELFILLQKTNYRLWEELIQLDKKEPLDGVMLTLKQAEHLFKHLKKYNVRNQHSNWIRLLRQRLKELRKATGRAFETVDVEEEVVIVDPMKETPLTKRIDEHYGKAAKAMKKSD